MSHWVRLRHEIHDVNQISWRHMTKFWDDEYLAKIDLTSHDVASADSLSFLDDDTVVTAARLLV